MNARNVIAVVLLFRLVCVAEEPDLKWVDAVAARGYSMLPSKSELESEVKRQLLQLRSAKTARIVPGKNITIARSGNANVYEHFPSLDIKKKEISKCQQRVTDAQDNLKNQKLNQVPDLPSEQPKVQSAGTVWAGRLHVVQVVDGNSTRVEIGYPVTSFRPGVGLEIKETSGLKNFTIWLEADTSGWTDGDRIDFKQPIFVTGTRQYDTVVGSTKTLLVARPWTEAELQRFKDWKPQEKSKK